MSERLARLFRVQSDGCRHLGSPFYAGLLARAADDLAAGGDLATVLAGHEDDAGPSALALRLAGAVHRLVLAGRAPALAAYFPSVGGVADVDAAWPLFRDAAMTHIDEVRELLRTPPQTNEVGRSAVLIGGLLHVTARTGLPVRLLELGASAGLNLRVEHFRYALGAGLVLGDADAPVRIDEPWVAGGAWPPVDARVTVVDRLGCDTEPADPLRPEDQLRLMSYVWPDQLARVQRLRAAFDVAARVPARVEAMGASSFLGRELAEPQPGVVTVVWHSVMWQYLDGRERDAVTATIERAGRRATHDAPLAWLGFEPRRVEGDRFAFLATLREWPGQGRERVIAEGQGHGPPVHWR